jgi:predicted metal-binding membrane protein
MVTRGRPVVLATLVIVVALVAWIATVRQMEGMDEGPGTDLGGLGWFVGVWVTMMAAMMFPSAAPMALVFSRISRERSGGSVIPMWLFLGGYLIAWTLYGLAAYGVYRGIRAADPAFLAWDAQGPVVVGAAVGLAGLYELTPLKRACLRFCRTPLHFVLHSWRDGRVGAVAMGVEHGAVCVGCCIGLMLVLFAVGVMSLFWMAVVAAVIFAQKLIPIPRPEIATAVVLVGLGAWIAAAPESVSVLHDPRGPGMPMESPMDDDAPADGMQLAPPSDAATP